jgi:hypothetical protein
VTEGAVDGGMEGEAVDAAPAEVVDGVAGVIADVPEGGADRLDGEAKAEVRGDAPDGASRP